MTTETIICIALAGIFFMLTLGGIVIAERLKELCEYMLRIAYAHTQISRQLGEGNEAIISLSERLCLSPDKLDGEDSENPADENPDNPDSMSEADKLAERRFSDGVLNILGYCGMPSEEAKH